MSGAVTTYYEHGKPVRHVQHSPLPWRFDDGGRKAAGFKGDAGDCVVRAVAIATGQSYQAVYEALSEGQRTQRKTRRSRQRSSARDGVSVRRKWFQDYMTGLGWKFVATMGIGTGCTVHLAQDELPMGHLIVSVSKHYFAVVNGVVLDTHDPTRGGTRCVYGYWVKGPDSVHPTSRRGA